MKKMKKFISLALVLVLALSLSVSAFAAPPATGSITVNNTTSGQAYTIYRIFDLKSFDTTTNNYAYQVNAAWANFINQATINNVYVTIESASGSVNWKTGADAQAFAKLALEYAKTNNIAAIDTVTAAGESVKFDTVELGYYLVDSALGALCALSTTDTEAIVTDKNTKPTLAKTVMEDSTNVYGETATADMGQAVQFRLKVNTGSNVADLGTGVDADYVITDTLPAGMTFDQNVAIAGWTAGTDYTVAYLKDVLTITLKSAKLATLAQNSDIVIGYSAKVDTDAVVGSNGNVNIATLSYNGYTTPQASATVYTYCFDLVKTDKDSKVLNGAKFELYSAKEATDAQKINLILSNGAYRIAGTGETATVIEAGNVKITGLDNGTYYLKEIEAPKGYNLLAEPIEVIVADANNEATVTAEGLWTAGGVQVVNLTGSELPSTGGIGTTIFYILGGLLAVGAVVVLVTRKRVHDTEA